MFVRSRAVDPDPHESAFNYSPRGEKRREKNALQFLIIVILLSLKKQIKLKMGAEAQLSVLRNLFTI